MIDTADIAVPAGVNKSGQRLFRKGDSLLTEDELQAAVEKLYASQVEDLELDRELGLVNHRVRSHDPKTLEAYEPSRPSVRMLIRSTETRPTQPSSTCARSRS
jgi:hypothetical protein